MDREEKRYHLPKCFLSLSRLIVSRWDVLAPEAGIRFLSPWRRRSKRGEGSNYEFRLLASVEEEIEWDSTNSFHKICFSLSSFLIFFQGCTENYSTDLKKYFSLAQLKNAFGRQNTVFVWSYWRNPLLWSKAAITTSPPLLVAADWCELTNPIDPPPSCCCCCFVPSHGRDDRKQEEKRILIGRLCWGNHW